MGRRDDLALWAVIVFVAAAAIPPLFLLFYYFGAFQIPAISAGILPVLALAGLFLAALIVVIAVAASGARRQKRYEWDDVFPERSEELQEALAAAASSPVREAPLSIAREEGSGLPFAKMFAAVIVVALLAVVLISAANFSGLKDKFFGNQSNESKAVEKAPPVDVEVKGNASFIPDVGKLGSKAAGLALSAKHKIQEVPARVWAVAAGFVIGVAIVAALVVSHITGQLGEIPAWLMGLAYGVRSAFGVAVRNKHKLKFFLAFLAVAVSVLAAAFVFWKKSAALPRLSGSANALGALRDFALVYRLYIIIGIFALIVVIAILLFFERKAGKRKPT